MYRRLMGLEEAVRAVWEAVRPRPLGVEEVGLWEAYGRVLAEDVVSPVDVPPFDRAAMDGYAVRAEDTFTASDDKPVALRVVGECPPGRPPEVRVGSGEAARIATGAPLPEGADAVVPVEHTFERDGVVYVLRGVPPRANVMARGADIREGDVVLRRGVRLHARELGVLSAIGLDRVKVYVRPRVAVFSSGDELVSPGGELAPYTIYDVNWITVSASVRACCCEPVFMGIVRDDLVLVEEAIMRGLSECDVVVFTGGSSVGVGDHMRRVLRRLEPGVVVDGVRVKPGKPTIVGVHQGKPVFCLPGYPTSALIAFTVFAAPVLRAMAGLESWERGRVVRARLAVRIRPAPGRTTFVTVRLRRRGDVLEAVPIFKGSGAITTLAHADGFIVVPEEVDLVPEGSEVEVHLFEGV